MFALVHDSSSAMALAFARSVACAVLIVMSAVAGIGIDRTMHLPGVVSGEVADAQNSVKRVSSGCEHRVGGSCELQAIAQVVLSDAEPLLLNTAFEEFQPALHRGVNPSAEPDPPRTV